MIRDKGCEVWDAGLPAEALAKDTGSRFKEYIHNLL